MFARHVVVRLKAKAAPEFTRLVETQVIPMLRKQKGFLDEIVFIAPDLTEAVGNSFWETQADAEAYSRKCFLEVVKSLESVLAGARRSELRMYPIQHFTRSRLAMERKRFQMQRRAGKPLSRIHQFRPSFFKASL
jgi:hypothetical protein